MAYSLHYLEANSRVDDAGCWRWIGPKTHNGYACGSAHRRAYELLRGPIPEGLQLDHLCRVCDCINPEHLEPVTLAENRRRAEPYRVMPTHCKHGHELTPELIYVYRGKRSCRECKRQDRRRWKERHLVKETDNA